MPSVSSFVTLFQHLRVQGTSPCTSLVIFDTRPDATYELRATLLRPTTSLESDSGQWQCCSVLSDRDQSEYAVDETLTYV